MRLLSFTIIILSFAQAAISAPLPVPIVRQSTNYSCGPASLMSLLYYWKVYEDTESELFPLVKTDPQVGTSPQNLVKGAAHFGLEATFKTEVTFEEIQEALNRKEPPIIDFQAWADVTPESWENDWEDGHYAVVVDMDAKWIYFMDPVLGNSYGKLERSEFETRWHDIDGDNKKLHRAAIFISGKTPAAQFPLPITLIK